MTADNAQKIETLLADCGTPCERTGEKAWTLRLGPDRNMQASLICLASQFDGKSELLKIYMPVGKLPDGAGADFLKDLLRKNRDLGHGGFAVVGRDVVAFVDTLQLSDCDSGELRATLDWVARSSDIFKEKLDYSKLPYLDPY